MAKTIATITGTALKPGVSRNGRWYKPDHVAEAVRTARDRIAAGEKPMVMLTFHGADDNSREIAASLTEMSLAEDGSAEFAAGITDTPAGWDIARLADITDGKPAHLRNVSIRGSWVGKVRKERGPGGQVVETADGVELDGIDFTKSPGVAGAAIKTFAWVKDDAAETAETSERVLITESVQEACVTITEDAPAVPEGVREALRAVFGEPVTEASTPALSRRGSGLSDDSGRPYADPGYQADKKQRYDLSTKAKAKAAWSYISQAANAKLYTGPQLKQVKKRIVAALKRFGVTVASEGWCIDPAVAITEAIAEYAGMDPECAGSYSLSATNGPTTVTVCSYGLDPADLQVILAQACKGAGMALCALDPDMDADIDVPGADAEDTDGDAADGTALPDNGDGVDSLVTRMMAALRGESAEDPDAVLAEAKASAAVTETAPDPAPEPDAERQQETEAPMAETTTTEAVATPAAIPQDVLDAAVAKTLAAKKTAKQAAKQAKAAKKAKAAETAPAAPVAETAAPGEDAIARMVKEGVAAALAAEGLTETVEAKVARLVREQVTAAKQELTEQGAGPGRKGLSPGGAVTETGGGRPGAEPGLNSHGMPSDWPDKPLHEYTSDEMDRYVGPVVTRHYLGQRADLIA